MPQPFKYAGQYGVMAEPDGLYYMRARYYDPQVGRFISEDPKGFDGGDLNLYAYVGNNPVMGVDPSGKVWFMPSGAEPVFGFNGENGPLSAGSPYMEPLEKLPNMHQTALFHDKTVDYLKTNIKFVDNIVNVVTMLPAAVTALGYNIATTPSLIYHSISNMLQKDGNITGSACQR